MAGILIVAERIAPRRGGLAVATARLAGHARALGEPVHVIHPDRDVSAGLQGRRERDGVIHHPIGAFPRDEDTLQSLVRCGTEIARRHRLDLVHGIYATRPGYAATVIARTLSIPSVVSLRGNDLDRGMFRAADLPFLERALTNEDPSVRALTAFALGASGNADYVQRLTEVSTDPVAWVRANAIGALVRLADVWQ